MWRNAVLDCIIFTQICIGGENSEGEMLVL